MANKVNLLLIIIIAKIHICQACGGGSKCPTHKPFCSSAGCVEECPEPFYKNNTMCVLNCGDMFVGEDMTCVQACSDQEFIEETLKFVGQEFIERKCVRSCRDLIYNKTCAQSCHMHSNVIMGDDLNLAEPGKRMCVEQCPDTHLYKTNVTYREKSVAFCSKGCNFLIENGYCVSSCSEGNVIFNRTCIASCPKSHPVRNQQGECTQICTEINFDSGMCDCPQNMSYIQNNTCVSECSPSMYIKYWINRNFCVQSCDPGDYILNKTCVMSCPSEMFVASNECLQSCPKTMPFYCRNCDISSYENEKIPFTCFKTCPEGLFRDNLSCIKQCTNFTVDGECLNNCPHNKHLVFENATGLNCGYFGCSSVVHQTNCLSMCPFGYFQRNNDCIAACTPEDYIFNSTCLYECPNKMKSRKQTVHFSEIQYNGYGRYDLTSKSTLTNTCVDNCEASEFQLNSTCLSACPSDVHYVTNGHCEKGPCATDLYYNKTTYVMCVDNCKASEFQFNNTCVSACPSDHHYITNGHCGNGPCDTDFYYNKTTYVMCVNTCDDGDFILYNKMCVNICPSTTFAWNNTCVNKCPDDDVYYQYVVTNPCKDICSINAVNRYASCYEECSEDMYALNNSCIYYCPLPYVSVRGSCLLSCPHNLPFKNATTLKTKEWRQNEDNTWTYQTYDNNIVECVSECNRSGRPLDFDALKCVEVCPNSNGYVQDNVCKPKCSKNMVANKESFGMECRMSCPDGKVLYNETCIQSCPNEAKYQYGGICITRCPSESPFAVIDKNNMCVKRCEDGKLYHNGYCVSNYKCNITMIKFEGQCLERCPEGYRYFVNECLKDLNGIVALSVILATLIAVCAYNRKIIVDYGRVWCLLIRWRSSGVPEFLKILEQPEPFQFEIDHDPAPVMFQNPIYNTNYDDEPLLQLEELI